jgi:hypothetical protein
MTQRKAFLFRLEEHIMIIQEKHITSYLKGAVAEWSGAALQKLLHRFESGRHLLKQYSL